MSESKKAVYKTVVQLDDQVNATGLSVPPEVVAAFGAGQKPKVRVTINGFTYRTTVAAYRGVYMMPLSQERREAAGVAAGDEVEVHLELDLEPRTVDVPQDLAAALLEHPGANERFAGLAFSKRKEFVRQVESAKSAVTRLRRIAKIVAEVIG